MQAYAAVPPVRLSRHAFFAALAALILVLGARGPASFVRLAYYRSAILEGEVWRLLTTHLVHAGPSHLAANMAGLGLVWAAFARRAPALTWVACALAAALGASVGVLVAQPRVEIMAGLSSVLHGLLAGAALNEGRRGSRMGIVLGTVLALKLAWDLLAGALPSARSLLGGPIAAEAHLFGAVAGALCVLWLPSPPPEDASSSSS